MPELFTPDGKRIDLDAEQAEQAFATGQAGFASGQRVHVRTPDGEIANIDAADVQGALQGGYRIASDVEVKQARLLEEHGTTGQAAIATAEGVARGLTFGLSDVAERAAGVSAKSLKARKEANPELSTGGEVVGAIAPMLFTGGGSTAAQGAGLLARGGQAARIAGAIPRGTAALGRGTEAAVTGLLGSRAGTLLGRAAAVGAGGAVEGAVIGAGQAISEAALDDRELTAEQLIAHARDGALFGGAAGAALGGTAAAVGKAATKVRQAAPESVKKAFSREGIADLLDNYRDKQSFLSGKNPSGGKAFVKEAIDKGGVEKIGRLGREEIGIGPTDTVADVLEKSTAARERLGQKIGEALQRFDDVGSKARPNASRIAERINKDILGKLESTNSKALKSLGKRVREELGGQELLDPNRQWSFAELHEQRRVLDRLAFKETAQGAAGKTTPFGEEIAKARRIVEGEIEDAAERASRELGEDVSSIYKDAKERFQAVDLMNRMSRDAVRSNTANDAVGLISGNFGNALAMADAVFSGGIGIDTVLIPFVAGKLHKIARQQFPALAAEAASQLRSATTVTQRAVDIERRTDSAIKSFFNTAKTTATEVPKRVVPAATAAFADRGKSRRERYDSVVAELDKSPETVVDRIADRMAQSGDNDLTGAYSASIARGIQFLQEKRPAPRNANSTLRPDLDKTQRIADSEMSKFLRYAEAVKDPMSVVDAIERGDVTREGVEAMAAVYPKMYERLVARVTDMVSQMEEPLPYGKTVQLSVVLRTPLHPSLRPEFIRAAQALYGEQPEAQAQASAQSPNAPQQELLAPSARKPLDTSSRHMTQTQSLEA